MRNTLVNKRVEYIFLDGNGEQLVNGKRIQAGDIVQPTDNEVVNLTSCLL